MPEDPRELLEQELPTRGIAARLVKAERVCELREDLGALHRAGAFDEVFYRQRLEGFRFDQPAGFSGEYSLVVAAAPQPSVRFVFQWRGSCAEFFVPPTYLHWRETDGRIEAVLAEVLASSGHRVAPANLPKKMLAVRAGLAEYGRNNISYVRGMGSYHRLAVFYTDAPCPQESWREPALLDRCNTCVACLRRCPTGAIGPDRFLLRGERCISYLNEAPTSVPFPDWLDPAWHNCLVGCLLCQSVCPENSGSQGRIEEGAIFSQQETALLLAGASLEQLPASLVEKLARSDLADIMDVLPRNLKILLDRKRG